MSAWFKSFFKLRKLIRTHLVLHLIDLMVFFWNSFQLTICRTKMGMLYKTKLRWGQSLELIYTQKFQKAGMSILFDAKSYYVKNSSVNSVITFIQINILIDNEFLDFPSLKNNYLRPLIFR